MSGELIEFVAPRSGAFGDADDADFVGIDDGGTSTFDDDPPRPPWVTAAAVLAVTALLAGGVIAAAPWRDDPAAPSPAPSTTLASDPDVTATDATGSTPDTVADDPLLPDGLERPTGWLPVDDRSGFTVSSAASVGGAGRPGDAFAIWMTEGATRTSGRWVAVDAVPVSTELARDGTVIDVVRDDGTWPAVVTTSDDGVITLAVARDRPEASAFTLTGFGWTLDELRALAVGIEVGTADDVIAVDDALLADGGLLDGLAAVFAGDADVRSGDPVPGRQRAITWLDSLVTGSSATVVVSALATPAILVSDLLVRRPIDERSLRRVDRGRLSALAAAGRVVSLFEVVAERGRIGASWFDGNGNEVAVLTDAGVPELLDLVVALEPASAAQWADALATERTQMTGDANPAQIGGSIGDGWLVQVSARSIWLNAVDGFFTDGWPPPEGRVAVRYVSPTAGYLVLTDATRGNADGRIATAVAVRQGDRTQDVELLPLVGGIRTVAVRIDPRAPYTVVWLAGDGSVLNESRWPA